MCLLEIVDFMKLFFYIDYFKWQMVNMIICHYLYFAKKLKILRTIESEGEWRFIVISEITYFYRKVNVYMVIYRHKDKAQHKMLLQNW